ncbi:MAG: hypothetical protein ACK6EB_19155, partial [Planctomyces sp.]
KKTSAEKMGEGFLDHPGFNGLDIAINDGHIDNTHPGTWPFSGNAPRAQRGKCVQHVFLEDHQLAWSSRK